MAEIFYKEGNFILVRGGNKMNLLKLSDRLVGKVELLDKGRQSVKWLKLNKGRMLVSGMIAMVLVFSGCSSSEKKSSAVNPAADQANGNGYTSAKSEAVFNSNRENSDSSKAVASTTFSEANTKVEQKAKATTGAVAVSNGPFPASNDGMNRKVIYKGNLIMEVPNYIEAQTEINNLISLSGGYILQFAENQSTKDQSGNYVIKIPSNGFTSFIADLKKIKHIDDIRHNIQGQDVSEEYVDLESRLKAKQVVEARLLAFMDKAQRTEELLSFSNELAKVQEAVEQIKGRMRYLDKNVEFSTIELRLYQKGSAVNGNQVPTDSLLFEMKKAVKSSLHVMVSVFKGVLIVLAAILPILLVAALIGIPLLYFIRRNRKFRSNLTADSSANSNINSNYSNRIVEVEQEPRTFKKNEPIEPNEQNETNK